MLMKIAHYNDGKEKWESHTCYLFNDSDVYHEFDITNIRGYGETKEEAIQNLKKELQHYFDELHSLEKCFTKQTYWITILLRLIALGERFDEDWLYSKI